MARVVEGGKLEGGAVAIPALNQHGQQLKFRVVASAAFKQFSETNETNGPESPDAFHAMPMPRSVVDALLKSLGTSPAKLLAAARSGSAARFPQREGESAGEYAHRLAHVEWPQVWRNAAVAALEESVDMARSEDNEKLNGPGPWSWRLQLRKLSRGSGGNVVSPLKALSEAQWRLRAGEMWRAVGRMPQGLRSTLFAVCDPAFTCADDRGGTHRGGYDADPETGYATLPEAAFTAAAWAPPEGWAPAGTLNPEELPALALARADDRGVEARVFVYKRDAESAPPNPLRGGVTQATQPLKPGGGALPQSVQAVWAKLVQKGAGGDNATKEARRRAARLAPNGGGGAVPQAFLVPSETSAVGPWRSAAVEAFALHRGAWDIRGAQETWLRESVREVITSLHDGAERYANDGADADLLPHPSPVSSLLHRVNADLEAPFSRALCGLLGARYEGFAIVPLRPLLSAYLVGAGAAARRSEWKAALLDGGAARDGEAHNRVLTEDEIDLLLNPQSTLYSAADEDDDQGDVAAFAGAWALVYASAAPNPALAGIVWAQDWARTRLSRMLQWGAGQVVPDDALISTMPYYTAPQWDDVASGSTLLLKRIQVAATVTPRGGGATAAVPRAAARALLALVAITELGDSDYTTLAAELPPALIAAQPQVDDDGDALDEAPTVDMALRPDLQEAAWAAVVLGLQRSWDWRSQLEHLSPEALSLNSSAAEALADGAYAPLLRVAAAEGGADAGAARAAMRAATITALQPFYVGFESPVRIAVRDGAQAAEAARIGFASGLLRLPAPHDKVQDRLGLGNASAAKTAAIQAWSQVDAQTRLQRCYMVGAFPAPAVLLGSTLLAHTQMRALAAQGAQLQGGGQLGGQLQGGGAAAEPMQSARVYATTLLTPQPSAAPPSSGPPRATSNAARSVTSAATPPLTSLTALEATVAAAAATAAMPRTSAPAAAVRLPVTWVPRSGSTPGAPPPLAAPPAPPMVVRPYRSGGIPSAAASPDDVDGSAFSPFS